MYMYIYIYRVGCILKKLNLLKHRVVIEIMRKQNSKNALYILRVVRKLNLIKHSVVNEIRRKKQ